MSNEPHPLTTWRESLPESERSFATAGRILGVSASMVYRYEKGLRRIPAEKAIRFEAVTGISRGVFRPDIFMPAA